VANPPPLRSTLVVLLGAAVYFALLWFFYAWAPYTVIPQWLRHILPNARVALVTWFTLLNVGGAILAAIPVALGIVLGVSARRAVFGIIVGVVPALYILVGGVIEYGVPRNLEAWVVDIAQFFVVSLAVVAAVALFRGFPLTIGSSDRGAASSAGQGEGR
jgi:hypothetical protein